VERVVLNALAKLLRLCRRIFTPSAITDGIAFGEADPPVKTAIGTAISTLR
jgi:hypothetical protein